VIFYSENSPETPVPWGSSGGFELGVSPPDDPWMVYIFHGKYGKCHLFSMDENWGSPMTQESSIFWDPHGPGTPIFQPQFSAWLRGPVVGRNKGYEVEVWFTSGADATVRWFLWVAAYVG